MNAERALPVELQPSLVEEVVLRAVSGGPHEREFRRARDPLYRMPEGDARENAFWELHAAWFARLEMGRPIHAALAELPLLARSCQRCLVTSAPTRKDEGADLLVATAPADAAPAPTARFPSVLVERTVLIRLLPAAFARPDALLTLLRAELLHVADMVDPSFAYEPELPATDGGPGYARLLRDRYRALWDVTVASRLLRRGVGGQALVAQAQAAFAAAFPMLGAAAPAAFERFFATTAPVHGELLAFARMPFAGNATERLAPGAQCPLCRFPTHAFEPHPETMPAELVACIKESFPTWHPAHGLCRQCADLYRTRSLSLAAAALLPGSAPNTVAR